MSRRRFGAAFVALAVTAVALAAPDVNTSAASEWCPDHWDDAVRIDAGLRDVHIAGVRYQFTASIARHMGWAVAFQLPFETRPTGVFVQVVAADETALDDLEGLCVRMQNEGDSWTRRAHAGPIRVRPDGMRYRSDSAGNGPEWPGDRAATVELLSMTDGTRYIFDLGPVPIAMSD